MSAPTRVALLALACISLLGAAACGSTETDVTGTNPGDGKQIFADVGCDGCHTLAAADAKGTAGPSLDGTTLNQDQIREKIISGGGGMPSFVDLTDAQLDAVSAFVAGPGATR